MTDDIPLVDLDPQIEEAWPELQDAVEEVMQSGYFINGPNVETFEERVAERLGVDHAIGLNSGTDALVIGLRSLGIGPGDEVVTTPFTFFATVEAIGQVGARSAFVDIDPETFNLDLEGLQDELPDDAEALLPVHLFGQAADMDPILDVAEDHDLDVLEDTAQAFGGRYQDEPLGSLGDAGAFSFFPTKTLGAFGDGGMLVTDDATVAETARKLRSHGGSNKYANEMLGYNSRLDELQAAILRVRLDHLDERNRQRREAADRYHQLLDDIPAVETPTVRSHAHHVYHQFTIRVREGLRNPVKEGLAEDGISTKVYYPNPIHEMDFLDARIPPGGLPETERACEEVLSLPMYPKMEPSAQKRVAARLRHHVNANR